MTIGQHRPRESQCELCARLFPKATAPATLPALQCGSSDTSRLALPTVKTAFFLNFNGCQQAASAMRGKTLEMFVLPFFFFAWMSTANSKTECTKNRIIGKQWTSAKVIVKKGGYMDINPFRDIKRLRQWTTYQVIKGE